jgi:hypothetical protein
VSLAARLQFESGKTLAARVKDIGLGGCYFQSLARVELGESVRCMLHLSEEDVLELNGIVAFHRPYIGFGLEFNSLTKEKAERLKAIIAKTQEQE